MKRQKKKRATAKIVKKTPPKTRPAMPKAHEVVAGVKEMIAPLCESEGMELVQVEYQRESGGRVLRVYIDKPGGVGVDDCAYISRQTGDYLDVGLALEEAYRSEVSSPGVDRPLVKPVDFDRFKGREAKIRTCEPLEGRKNFKGVLLGMLEGVIHLSVDGTPQSIPFEKVEKARLVG